MTTNGDNGSVAQRALVRWMAREKITSADLARRMFASKKTVQAWRQGARSPQRDFALRLEAITGGRVRAAAW